MQAVPGIKVGPVPGSMMFPLWQEGQYPPDDFGPGGFNLIYYYMYLNHWQPMIANLYWNEVGRINNRDLELWSVAGLLRRACADLLPQYLLPAGGGRMSGDELF